MTISHHFPPAPILVRRFGAMDLRNEVSRQLSPGVWCLQDRREAWVGLSSGSETDCERALGWYGTDFN